MAASQSRGGVSPPETCKNALFITSSENIMCLVRNWCLVFRLACLLIEAFALKLYLWKKCDFYLLHPVFGFLFYTPFGLFIINTFLRVFT